LKARAPVTSLCAKRNADMVPRYHGRPPLFHAATLGYADPNVPTPDASSPVRYASAHGYAQSEELGARQRDKGGAEFSGPWLGDNMEGYERGVTWRLTKSE